MGTGSVLDRLNAVAKGMSWTGRPLGISASLLNSGAIPSTPASVPQAPDGEPLVYNDSTVNLNADGTPHTGAMVALIPTREDAARIAVPGGEPENQLHLTLAFLGKAADISSGSVEALKTAVAGLAAGVAPYDCDAFAVSIFNPMDDDKETCIVLGIGGDRLADAHGDMMDLLSGIDEMQVPPQHQPWLAHVTLNYTNDVTAAAQYTGRTGPITFDRFRVAMGPQSWDFPITGSQTKELDIKAVLQRPKSPKCKYCKNRGNNRVPMGEGRAIYACDSHEGMAKRAANKESKMTSYQRRQRGLATPTGPKNPTPRVVRSAVLDRAHRFANPMEYKRIVRTAAGARKYGVPIGSVIGSGHHERRAFKPGKHEHLQKVESQFHGWHRYRGANGRHYDVGKEASDGRYYATGARGWNDVIAEGATREEVLQKLNSHVGGMVGALKPGSRARAVSNGHVNTHAGVMRVAKRDGDYQKHIKNMTDDELNAAIEESRNTPAAKKASAAKHSEVHGALMSERQRRRRAENAAVRAANKAPTTPTRAASATRKTPETAEVPKKPLTVELKPESSLSPTARRKAERMIAEKYSTLSHDQRLHSAYKDLASKEGDFVSLADVREHPAMRDLSRAEQDAAIHKISRYNSGGRVIPVANSKSLTERDRRAALNIGGEPNHAISFSPGHKPSGSAVSRASAAATPTKRSASTKYDTMSHNQRLHSAYKDLAKNDGDFVSLADVREHPAFSGLTREQQDAEIYKMSRHDSGARVIPVANSKSLTKRDREAAIHIGGEPNHAIKFDKGYKPTSGDTSRTRTMKLGGKDMTADQVIAHAQAKPGKFLRDWSKAQWDRTNDPKKFHRNNFETAAANLESGFWQPQHAAQHLEGFGKLHGTLDRGKYMTAARLLRGEMRPRESKEGKRH